MNTDEKKKFAGWARKISASDERAFSELFHEVYSRLVKFAWQYTRQESDAHDIVQEVFIKLWKIRTAIDPTQPLLSYLYKMVRNRSLNYLRDRNNNISLDEAPSKALKANEDIFTEIRAEEKPAVKMLGWIEALPNRQREAIRLSRFDGLDHHEIAFVMQISPRTVNNHIVEALKTLRNDWQKYNTEQTKRNPL